MMFAQTLHYQIDNSGCKPQKTTVTGVFMVDGVEIYNGEGMQNQGGQNIEIGVFDQDGICRGAKFPTWRGTTGAGVVFNKYIYQLQIWGTDDMYYPTFKVYDHNNDMELDLVLDIDETIVWTSGGKYGGIALDQLYAINFTHNAAGGYDLTITPYSGTNDHYYLISSPVGEVAPEAVTNMVSPYAYDLYYFDQEQELEWINYKANAFNMIPGKGYLYANAGNGEDPTVTLTFPTTGTYDGDGVFPLDYVEGTDFAGMNLVGNPYNATATVTVTDDPDCQFYVMNAETGEIVASEVSTVEPMQGIFVKATASDKHVTFTVGETGDKVSKLSLNLLGNKGLVDRAIVNFGEGSLTKFQIHSNSTKLYIPVDGEDYAVVSSAEMGELPVSFKTEKSGIYTLAVSSDLSFSYLHLIDNKTGADIDLLATPSYSFEAQATDYASRFRLVFATGNSEDTFAFYSNGSFVISNEGEATVQVMDVTGRMLSSEAINGSASINVEGAAGVYMVRLVNGENVRVQKIIVK
jgi:hypothetical protein